jgi:hypothetical protein
VGNESGAHCLRHRHRARVCRRTSVRRSSHGGDHLDEPWRLGVRVQPVRQRRGHDGELVHRIQHGPALHERRERGDSRRDGALAGQWHWCGWRTTDPDFDPTVPHAGDPDYVYTLSGSSRARASIEPVPGSTLLSGELAVSGDGPSAGITIHYAVEYTHAEFASAEVWELSAQCLAGTVIPLPFTYFP